MSLAVPRCSYDDLSIFIRLCLIQNIKNITFIELSSVCKNNSVLIVNLYNVRFHFVFKDVIDRDRQGLFHSFTLFILFGSLCLHCYVRILSHSHCSHYFPIEVLRKKKFKIEFVWEIV